jgi:capsular polysaccharide biosynthesis protein
MTTNKPVMYKKAFLTTTMHHFIANRFPKLILYLRDRLNERAASEDGAGQRIWVERGKNANGRDVINKEEVYSSINRYGFTTIDFGQYTFGQQIGIDREMRVMVGPHGSAFAHCGFMQNRGQVIEIFSPLYINPSVIQLCQVMQHSYNQIVPPNKKFDPYQFDTDIMVDIDHLELVLSALRRGHTEMQ